MSENIQKLWRQWLHFWFAAGDPSTMAFIRIVTGVLVIYVHLVYSLDLNSFFGPKAWYGLEVANRERRELPTQSNDFWKWEWEIVQDSVRMPDQPHRHEALMNYLRSLPYVDQQKFQETIAFLDFEADCELLGQPLAQGTLAPLWYHQLYTPIFDEMRSRDYNNSENRTQQMRDRLKQVLPDTIVNNPRITPEQFRERKLKQLVAFYDSLPKIENDKLDQTRLRMQLITDYFLELDGNPKRRCIVRFAHHLADPKMTPEMREQELDYLDYWKIEKKLQTGSPIFSIWYHITDPTEMAIAHGVVIVIMVMFTLGLFTRITSVLTWLAAVSYINRNPQILFGQDTMMNILLIYLMVANCGATLSLDRWLACRKARRLSIARTGTLDAATLAYLEKPLPSVSCAFAQRLLQVHFCFIYMAAGLSKLKGGSWWGHTAFWQTLVNPEFTMVHFEWYEHALRWVAASRPAFAFIAATGVWFTLFIEISLPFLVWTKLRPWAVMFGLLLHMGVGIFMGLLVFSLFMMTMLLCYLPGSAVRSVLFSTDEKT